ncbi:MAG: ATP-binding protein [Bacteroidales bacterium]|nr:ATP-binding protein [Bacteroidales bacterium]
MKRTPVKTITGVLMSLAIIVLTATGYLSYRNFSAIVASMNVDLTPSLRLMNIRDLSMDIQNAENSIRIFSVTGDSSDLQTYYKSIKTLDARIASLRMECLNDPDLLEQTDTISALINDNIELWQELLLLNNNEKVAEELKQIAKQIDKATVVEPRKTEITEKKIEDEQPVVEVKEEEKEKPGFFKRLFGKKKETPADTAATVPPYTPPVILPEPLPEPQPPSGATISTEKKEEIKLNLGKIQKDDEDARLKLAEQETRIALKGTRLKEKIYDLISRMENEARLMSNAKKEEAEWLARQTFKWLLAFIITGTVLALSVIITVISYVRKSDTYNLAIIRSRDEAEELARTKELFMANMSHEIRTPVTAIAGFTEQLMHDISDPESAKTLGIIKSSADHLSRIINDVLDFSKLHNERISFETVNFSLRKIFGEVETIFRREAARNDTTLSFSISPSTPAALSGDPYRLRQVLINLVSNAVKFTKGGKVHFSADSEKRKDGKLDLVIKVTDTGIGIEESKINLVFEDFTQAEMSTTRKYGGTGLGLSIVKRITEMQGGTVSIKSRRGQGTQICCTIPFIEGDESLIGDEQPLATDLPGEVKKLRVLIVDDEEYNRMLFRMILNRWGISYSEATDGKEALEALRIKEYDIVFMDARMPHMDGLTSTVLIRNDLKLSIPVICISAAPPDDGGEKFRAAGMDSFLMKPFNEGQLLTAIMGVMPSVRNVWAARVRAETRNLHENVTADPAAIYTLAGGDMTFARQMLLSFIETTGAGIESLERALEAGDGKEISGTAHRLLPPCRHVGAAGMCSLLKRIEDEAGMAGAKAESVQMLRLLATEFSKVKEIITAEIRKIEEHT